MADTPEHRHDSPGRRVQVNVRGNASASGNSVIGVDQSTGKSISVVTQPDSGLSQKARQLIALGSAFVALATGVTMTAIWRDMSAPMYTFLRVVMALGAGAFGAFLDGFLKVRFGNWARAGGGLAVFLLVYFCRVSEPTSATPTTLPAPAGPSPTTSPVTR